MRERPQLPRLHAVHGVLQRRRRLRGGLPCQVSERSLDHRCVARQLYRRALQDECAAKCGGYVYPDADCAACGTERCCDEATACMQKAECAVLAACARACATTDQSCVQLCKLAHPRGVGELRAFGGCTTSKCANACIPLKWACLKQVTNTPPVATGPAIKVTYAFVSYERVLPIQGLSVRPCAATDLECRSPLVTPSGLTDADGRATVQLASNFFDGYAEVSGPGYPTELAYYPPLAKDLVTNPVALPTNDTFTLATTAIAPIDPGRAILIIRALDCQGNAAAGVSFTIEPSEGATSFYFARRLPSTTATATDDDTFASGGFVNVKAATGISVHATVAGNGLKFAPRTVYTRAGATTFTFLTMYASPP